MKTLIKIGFPALMILVMMMACDKVEAPYYTSRPLNNDTTGADTNRRTILLEDYTGHLCTNCAPAATVARNIQEAFENKVFVIAVHAGSFARPVPGNALYSLDLRSEAGNDWYGYSTFNIDQNPKGMVNRRSYNGNISFGTSEWTGAVLADTALPKIAILTVKNEFSADSLLTAKIGVKFLSSYSGNVTLTVCILEDEIYGGQKNIIPPDSTPEIKRYRFMHVLRGSMNGSWGEQIASNPAAGFALNKVYTADFEGKGWVPGHCSVIAFISDAETREVLHVAKSGEIGL